MPELPEMETYRKLLNDQIAGALIKGTEVTREKSINVTPETFNEQLTGRTVWYVERRGKNLLFHLDNGKRLELHLMLGGFMFFGREEDKPDRTAQVTIRFEHGNLYFMGLRLGHLHLLSVKEVEVALSGLGPDPFDKRLTPDKFAALFDKKRGTLKASLVDQHVIAGIGNCYADEIAYAASIRPDAKIPLLQDEDWERLHRSMHSVLQEAISRGGYMDQPLTAGDDLTGGYDPLCQVYDREGEECRRCGGTIEKIEVASRKAFLCPSCQKE